MRYTFKAARNRLVPLAALVLATALGGCVAYTGYPPTSYSYTTYPSGYYAGYPTAYTYSYNTSYTPDYRGASRAY